MKIKKGSPASSSLPADLLPGVGVALGGGVGVAVGVALAGGPGVAPGAVVGASAGLLVGASLRAAGQKLHR